MSTLQLPSVSHPSRKRFQNDSAPYLPVLTLDRNGNIQSLTATARRMLEYSTGATLDPCFFAHVHASNQHRVMRDLAHMVSHGKQQARWLLRLRTGNQRWRWYRAEVRNGLNGDDGRIQVRLRPV